MINQAEIHRMAHSEDVRERREVLYFLRGNNSIINDKYQAWTDLQKLTYDADSVVLFRATGALCSYFPHVPDKEQAWAEMNRLAHDENDNFVRLRATGGLGSAFQYVPNKEKAWADMIRLTLDKDHHYLRAFANHSLGRACIFKATEAESEEDFRNELEKALEFFEKSSEEGPDSNPAKFCLPFYRSLYTITFKKQRAEVEVQKYLGEAKNAVKGSESKEKLLEAVENLSNALKEVQKVQEMDFNTMKSDLNAYRLYCERAADLLDTTEDKAPGATKLIRRGLPIIDQKIKKIITEIQEKASIFCKQTQDTPLEDLGKEIYRQGKNFSLIRDPIGLEKGITNLQSALAAICAKMPESERIEACELLKKVNEELLIEDKLPLINMVLSKFSSQMDKAGGIDRLEKKLDEIMISLKPGIREELTITVGAEFLGTGAQHVITIPLQEISYPELKKDLENIKGKSMLKLDTLPSKLVQMVKAYLIRNNKDDLLK